MNSKLQCHDDAGKHLISKGFKKSRLGPFLRRLFRKWSDMLISNFLSVVIKPETTIPRSILF